MKLIDKYPALIVLEGSGVFSSGDIEFESIFEIVHYPQNVIIIPKEEPEINSLVFLENFKSQNLWKLFGHIGENIPISAEDLLCTSSSDLTFRPLNKDIIFGNAQKNRFVQAQFPLVGLFAGQVNLDFGNWQISTILTAKETNPIKSKSELWNLPLEGNTLSINNSKGASKQDFLDLANDISLLLSLAVGNSVVYNRQLYFENNRIEQEIWRKKPDYYFGTRQCIPTSELNHLIKRSLSRFEQWSKEKKDTFYAVVNSINSSSKGFVEDRLLHLTIAWESLANKWLPKESLAKNYKELDPLKKILKTAVDEFKLPENYDKDFIKGRVVMALNWERLLKSIMNLINYYNLDYHKLNLDIETLLKIRNDVAHYGQLRTIYSKKYLADLIFYNRTGLSVLLLTELGYDGLIEFKKDNWKTAEKIHEFYRNTPSP